MAKKIQTPSVGVLARNKKMIEVIKALNPLLQIEVRYTEAAEEDSLSPVVKYSDSNLVIELPQRPGSAGIDVILCINGEPYNATIKGEIGDAV